MICPICQKDMSVRREDTSISKTKNKLYDRTQYVCETDDVWIKVEIPQEKQPEQENKE